MVSPTSFNPEDSMNPDYYKRAPEGACAAPVSIVRADEPMGGVCEAIDRSRKAALSLGEAIEHLTQRLSGVLRPEPSASIDGGKPCPAPAISPMAEDLNDHAIGLGHMTDRVASLLRRLDV